jgi:hypothetical protein
MRWRSVSPVAVLGAIPIIARAVVADEGLGQLPGTQAELTWGLAGAGVRRSGEAAGLRRSRRLGAAEQGGQRLRV